MSNPAIPERWQRWYSCILAKTAPTMGPTTAMNALEELGAAELKLAAAEARNRELEAKAHCVENIEDIVRRKNKFADECERLEAERDQLRKQLAQMTRDRDLWASDHEEDCPNKNLLELAQEDVRELREQRDKLRATLIAVGRNLGGQISEQASDGFLEHLAEESRLMAQKLAEEGHAAKQFSEAVVRLTAQRDKLLIALGKIRRINCPDCDSPEIADAAIKAAALPATQNEEGEK